jgi:hypothetical protein
MGDFHGEPTGVLDNGSLQLEYLENSPRIVRLTPQGKENLFADLGKAALATPYGDFLFRGGHRLWYAPEEFPRTYYPDNGGSVVETITNGVRISQPVEEATSVEKSIEIVLDPKAPKVELRHRLRNAGSAAVELAPWALSMMRLGGVAIIPQPPGDKEAKLPNRHIVIWPYTEIHDPRLELGDDFILVRADAKLPALKFGCMSPQGWLGYWLNTVFFVKRFDPPQANMTYPDFGCNIEIYCNDQFIELETLGPLVNLEPGATVSHSEVWEVYDTLVLDWMPTELQTRLLK